MLTVPEVARRVGHDPETVRRWIRSGRLRSQKIGGQYFIDEADADALAAGDTTPLPPELKQMYDGSPMPAWERLVRDARYAH